VVVVLALDRRLPAQRPFRNISHRQSPVEILSGEGREREKDRQTNFHRLQRQRRPPSLPLLCRKPCRSRS
jgi:hypothetical protein